jgi:hypothetical protein
MKKLFILGAALFISACTPPQQTDQCMRVELFTSCLKNAPAGPNSVHNSNDWEEVVIACDSVSYGQSQRKAEQITKECLPS